VTETHHESDRAEAQRARRRVRWTVSLLALTALAIYGGFVARGVFG